MVCCTKIISRILSVMLRVLRFILVLILILIFGANYENLIEYLYEELRERVVNLLYTSAKLDASILSKIRSKIVVITCGDTGLGQDLAKVMLENRATVIIGIRLQKSMNHPVIRQLKDKYRKTLVLFELNMASMESIICFATNVNKTIWYETDVRRVDILFNNASVIIDNDTRQITKDGFEMHFGSNHLGHFFLTLLLKESLKTSPNARVIMISSSSHMLGTINFDDINLEQNYNKHSAYFQSKLANVLFARELSRRLSQTNIKVYCVHPGYTRLEHNWTKQSFVSIFLQIVFNAIVCIRRSQAKQIILYCALNDSVESGYYYRNCGRVHTNSLIVNDEFAQRLWKVSCEQLLKSNYFQSLEQKWQQQNAFLKRFDLEISDIRSLFSEYILQL